MKILVVGGGGREHALAWKAAQSPRAERVFVAPGNAGTALEPRCENVPIPADDIGALADFAAAQDIGLTIVGPEVPLVAGIVDEFQRRGLKCFGPSAACARLEGSKAFSKAFFDRHGIPTAAWGEFSDADAACAYIRQQGAPVVVKADGLAAGKGVIVAQTVAEAEAAARDMLSGNRFGDAGARVVVEEFLSGEEASFIVMVDGRHVLPLASSQDHKARDDGDQGPNTGGMGAYSPAPVVDAALHDRIMREVIAPTVAGMAAEGTPYTGFLYAGVMVGADGAPRVLEFNCRFGDPETQPVLFRLRSDLVELCLAALEGALDRASCDWDPRAALGVVLAAGGYPDDYRKGDPISGLEADAGRDDLKIFHAGTRADDDRVLTSGGRVLCAVALGDDVAEAQRKAYALADAIRWDGVYYRRDIGWRAIGR
ncbi:phosphoribosylamine--glycine ligase [Thioalkalivibrio sp. XN279]|uniref:phosphoribosylamine--glycine ligase n=1 Tax=Thioalkalivibrio sp. XN279 TaxID=2714953 RepID=UPI00140BC052|nr:phosphoribosylamine--glycine ligase [Thioalkalivibrio sp. XN279]